SRSVTHATSTESANAHSRPRESKNPATSDWRPLPAEVFFFGRCCSMAKDDRPGERKQEAERAGPRGGSVVWSATPQRTAKGRRIEIQEGTGVPNRAADTSAKTA